MMDAQNQLFRLRVGTDGKISLSRQIMSIPSTISIANIVSVPKKMLEAGIEAPKRVLEAGIEARDKMQIKAKRRWRKAVTGDPEKRIRDHMNEVPQVKLMDKLSFTMRTGWVGILPFWLARAPLPCGVPLWAFPMPIH